MEYEILFKDDNHKKAYEKMLAKAKSRDCYHKAALYLFALDEVCRRNIESVFDFDADCIIPEGLHKGWQTGTSVKTTRLAFNLWNSFVDEEAVRSTPTELFCGEYIEYYFEAIRLRFM